MTRNSDLESEMLLDIAFEAALYRSALKMGTNHEQHVKKIKKIVKEYRKHKLNEAHLIVNLDVFGEKFKRSILG